MSRPTFLRIHLSAIEHNLRTAQQQFPEAFTWAVVKANAYGHGLFSILPALHGAKGFALLEMDAAIRLRQWVTHLPILLLEGPFSYEDASLVVQHNLIPVIHEQNQIEWFDRLYQKDPSLRLPIYLKVNTGMNRLGFSVQHSASVLNTLKAKPWVGAVTMMMHFASADQVGGVEAPLARFESLKWNGATSIANSAALFGWSRLHQRLDSPGQAVRPGITLYGSSPFITFSAHDLNLQATMTFEASIIAVQQINQGDSVGYSATFTAEHPMRIGIVACGYADGYPRHAGTGTPVWVEGHQTILIGRISMDMLVIDITQCPEVGIGSLVELWGTHVAIDKVAQHAGTIAYELMCGITSRVQRDYNAVSTLPLSKR